MEQEKKGGLPRYTNRDISIAIGSLMSFEEVQKIDQRVIVQKVRAASSLQALNNGVGVLVGLGVTTKVTSKGLQDN